MPTPMLMKSAHFGLSVTVVVACALTVVCAAPLQSISPFTTTATTTIPFQTDAAISYRILRRSSRSDAASAKLWYTLGTVLWLATLGILLWHFGAAHGIRNRLERRTRAEELSSSDNSVNGAHENERSAPSKTGVCARLAGATAAKISFTKDHLRTFESDNSPQDEPDDISVLSKAPPRQQHQLKETLREGSKRHKFPQTLRDDDFRIRHKNRKKQHGCLVM